MTVTVFIVSLLAAMAIGMPIAYALLVCGVALMGFLAATTTLVTFDSQILAQRFVEGADNFPLLAVPFFLLAGEFMNAGGLSRRIVNFAMAWIGHYRGDSVTWRWWPPSSWPRCRDRPWPIPRRSPPCCCP